MGNHVYSLLAPLARIHIHIELVHYLPLIAFTSHYFFPTISKYSTSSLICETSLICEIERVISMASMADQVWFSIIPKNEIAKNIVNDSRNQQHVVVTESAKKVIRVVFRDILKEGCILSFGRHLNNDIKCNLPEGRTIAQNHCAFVFHNKCLILRDLSTVQTTTISPVQLDPSKWRMDTIPRQRAIPESGDWSISIGPANFLLRFRQGMPKLDSLNISFRS